MAKKKLNRNTFVALSDFSFDFVELLQERNLDQLIKDVKDEMIADCAEIEIIISEIRDTQIQFQYLINYTSKYSFFIYHFEQYAAFEYCAEIRKFFITIAKTYFQVSDELLEAMICDSVETYRLID